MNFSDITEYLESGYFFNLKSEKIFHTRASFILTEENFFMPDSGDSIGKGGKMASAPTGLEPKGGGITSWKDVKWTKNKLIGTIIGLGLPYLFAIILTWIIGASFATYILIGVGMLAGFIFLVVGWIDSDEF